MALGNVKGKKKGKKQKSNPKTGKVEVLPAELTRLELMGDSSYSTGGMAGVAAKIATRIDNHTTIVDMQVNADGYTCRYDHSNDKIVVFDGSTEVAALTDLSSVTFYLSVWSY